MTIASLATSGSFWAISSWGNGAYYLTNQRVGVEWNLMVDSGTHMTCETSDTIPKDAHSFVFNPYLPINDLAYSSIDVNIFLSESLYYFD